MSSGHVVSAFMQVQEKTPNGCVDIVKQGQFLVHLLEEKEWEGKQQLERQHAHYKVLVSEKDRAMERQDEQYKLLVAEKERLVSEKDRVLSEKDRAMERQDEQYKLLVAEKERVVAEKNLRIKNIQNLWIHNVISLASTSGSSQERVLLELFEQRHGIDVKKRGRKKAYMKLLNREKEMNTDLWQMLQSCVGSEAFIDIKCLATEVEKMANTVNTDVHAVTFQVQADGDIALMIKQYSIAGSCFLKGVASEVAPGMLLTVHLPPNLCCKRIQSLRRVKDVFFVQVLMLKR